MLDSTFTFSACTRTEENGIYIFMIVSCHSVVASPIHCPWLTCPGIVTLPPPPPPTPSSHCIVATPTEGSSKIDDLSFLGYTAEFFIKPWPMYHLFLRVDPSWQASGCLFSLSASWPRQDKLGPSFCPILAFYMTNKRLTASPRDLTRFSIAGSWGGGERRKMSHRSPWWSAMASLSDLENYLCSKLNGRNESF